MLRVQFNNQKSFKTVEFSTLGEKVKLTGKNLKPNESGFKVYRLNGDLLGDYSDYKKCEAVEDGLVLERSV